MLITEVRLTREGARSYRDAAAAHSAVTAITDQDPEGVLWGMPRSDRLIIQHEKPLPIGAFSHRTVWEHRTMAAPETPPTGAHIQYGLIANATRQDNTTRKRHPIPPDQVPGWVERKLGDALNLRSIDFEDMPPATGRRGRNRIVHHRVMVTGEATVKNQKELSTLQNKGVGRGKAYGCGMILVRGRGDNDASH